MAAIDDIYASVRLRLPFLPNNQDSEDLVAAYAGEAIYLLATCFGLTYEELDAQDPIDLSNLTRTQKYMMADVISILLIIRRLIQAGTGSYTAEDVGVNPLYKKKMKAGDVEIEYGLLADKGIWFGIDTDKLLAEIRGAAHDRFYQYPCYLALLGMQGNDIPTIFITGCRKPTPYDIPLP